MDKMPDPKVYLFIDDDGFVRTVNHRVKVKMIGQNHVIAGESIQDIAAHYDITLADVHAALAYYFEHQETFDRRLEENWRMIYERGQSIGDVIDRLKQKRGENSDETE